MGRHCKGESADKMVMTTCLNRLERNLRHESKIWNSKGITTRSMRCHRITKLVRSQTSPEPFIPHELHVICVGLWAVGYVLLAKGSMTQSPVAVKQTFPTNCVHCYFSPLPRANSALKWLVKSSSMSSSSQLSFHC